jgi:hypothetical protein
MLWRIRIKLAAAAISSDEKCGSRLGKPGLALRRCVTGAAMASINFTQGALNRGAQTLLTFRTVAETRQPRFIKT